MIDVGASSERDDRFAASLDAGEVARSGCTKSRPTIIDVGTHHGESDR
jgi:hypothetical protein